MTKTRDWRTFNIARSYPLTPNRIEDATNFFVEEDAKFNYKPDTVYFEREKQIEMEDGVDNLIDTGWFYND